MIAVLHLEIAPRAYTISERAFFTGVVNPSAKAVLTAPRLAHYIQATFPLKTTRLGGKKA
jgi:hypothetical protein